MQFSPFAAVLQILRWTTDRNLSVKDVALADDCRSLDPAECTNFGTYSDRDARADDRVWADFHAVAECRFAADDRRRMNHGSLGTIRLSISASATVSPLTVATP